MCLAFALSENRHTSQKYNKFFPVLMLENMKQLTRNSYLEGSNFCLLFVENSVQTKTM